MYFLFTYTLYNYTFCYPPDVAEYFTQMHGQKILILYKFQRLVKVAAKEMLRFHVYKSVTAFLFTNKTMICFLMEIFVSYECVNF